MAPTEKVIELSVEETNKLRAELGLAPLRGCGGDVGGSSSAAAAAPAAASGNGGDQKEVLEMSVDETNALREKLGLAPLRQGKKKEVVHAPAVNEAEVKAEADRAERARVEREVREGISKFAAAARPLGEDATTAQSWAQQMRSSSAAAAASGGDKKDKKKKKKKKKKSKKATGDDDEGGEGKLGSDKRYDEEDLKGLKVAHAVSELQEGSTTVLTLADAPLLKTRDDGVSGKVVGLNDGDDEDGGGPQLENVNLAEQKRTQDGLRQKRRMEMGQGRAGGYSGFDDDEFEELGGTQGPARMSRGAASGGYGGIDSKKSRKARGFQIGAHLEEQEGEEESDLFAFQHGGAVSLDPSKADAVASDFMTIDEDEAEREKKKKLSKKEKKDAKFKKKKRKDKKKDKKKHKRKVEESDDDEDDDEEPAVKLPSSKGLLQELQETAVEQQSNVTRKRRRSDDDDDDDDDAKGKAPSGFAEVKAEAKPGDSGEGAADDVDDLDKAAAEKRAKFDAVMAKGNRRTVQAFSKQSVAASSSTADLDDEPDDAFLNAALAKARRLNRLKQMAAAKNKKGAPTAGAAEAVAEAVQSTRDLEAAPRPDEAPGSGGGTVTFSVDETREFTRALRARAEQVDRDQAKKAAAAAAVAAAKIKTEEDSATPAGSPVKQEESSDVAAKKEAVQAETVFREDEEMEDVEANIEELAKEVKEDPEDVAGALDGATGTTVSMGRGLGGIMGLFQQTGELSRKNAGKEEMRGRAKDKRTYEDYEALNLKEVVKIDERTATDKDKELAHREIKLEYRDKHGRLLTRKEAFRDLSYQFHGYGSGKRKEAKKNEQIAREQAESRLASRQAAEGGVGTFGALKATQKATGKAFVVHKT